MIAPRWQPAALVLLTLAACAAGAPAPAPAGNPPPGMMQFAEQLARPVQFSGFEADPKMTLQEALDAIGDRYDLHFRVNEAAFAKEKVKDVPSQVIAEKAVPKMVGVNLDTVLRTILERVPCPSGATYLLRNSHIEITTGAAVRKELGRGDDDRLLPLVTVFLDRQLLATALQTLSQHTGISIVLDGRAAEQGRTPVTASLANVPVDTAAKILADMAGLDSVLLDNVCYVTTRENANRLRAEQERKHPRGLQAPAETEKEPAPAPKEEGPAPPGERRRGRAAAPPDAVRPPHPRQNFSAKMLATRSSF